MCNLTRQSPPQTYCHTGKPPWQAEQCPDEGTMQRSCSGWRGLRSPDRLREHRAERVHVEHAPGAAVYEAPRGALLLAEVAHPPGAGGAGGDVAAQREAVPRVREEGDGLLEVVSASLVDVDVAGVAAVAGEAGELGAWDRQMSQTWVESPPY